MEIDAVKDHAGWAIKLARDIIKRSTKVKVRIKNQVVIKLGTRLTNQWLWSYQSLETMRNNKMGVLDSYQGEKLETVFFSLHVVVDNLLSKSQFVVEKEKVVTNCLQQLSTDQQLRNDWVTVIYEGFSKPVAFVLQKVCIMNPETSSQYENVKAHYVFLNILVLKTNKKQTEFKFCFCLILSLKPF